MMSINITAKDQALLNFIIPQFENLLLNTDETLEILVTEVTPLSFLKRDVTRNYHELEEIKNTFINICGYVNKFESAELHNILYLKSMELNFKIEALVKCFEIEIELKDLRNFLNANAVYKPFISRNINANLLRQLQKLKKRLNSINENVQQTNFKNCTNYLTVLLDICTSITTEIEENKTIAHEIETLRHYLFSIQEEFGVLKNSLLGSLHFKKSNDPKKIRPPLQIETLIKKLDKGTEQLEQIQLTDKQQTLFKPSINALHKDIFNYKEQITKEVLLASSDDTSTTPRYK